MADEGPADRLKLKKMGLTFLFHELSDMEPTDTSNLGLQSVMVNGTGCVALLESDRKSKNDKLNWKTFFAAFMSQVL